MKKNLKCQCLLFMSLAFFSLSCKQNEDENAKNRNAVVETKTFSNPLDVEFGDPYILNDGDGNYYMYGTGGGAVDGFATYSSKDLVNWKFEGQIYKGNEEGSWAVGDFWAPEVYKFNNKYYMFFSAQWGNNPNDELENFKIGVAVADKPTGPFKEISDAPLFDPGYPVIDANVFKDDDGKYYLYYSRVAFKHPVETEISKWAREKGWFDEIEESWVYGIELEPDFSGVKGEPQLLLRPPERMDEKNAEWESRSVTSKEVNRRWTEGSYTFKQEGIYYMMYSANFYGGENYAVGYSTATAPLGSYQKAANNPILEKNINSGGNVTGTGHNSLVFSKDSTEIYAVYHGRTKSTGDERVVFIDRLEILENGKLQIKGPTTTSQTHPFLQGEIK